MERWKGIFYRKHVVFVADGTFYPPPGGHRIKRGPSTLQLPDTPEKGPLPPPPTATSAERRRGRGKDSNSLQRCQEVKCEHLTEPNCADNEGFELVLTHLTLPTAHVSPQSINHPSQPPPPPHPSTRMDGMTSRNRKAVG